MASSSSNSSAGSGAVLVVGGDSMVGRALAAALEDDGGNVYVTTRRRATAGGRRLYADLDDGEWDDVTAGTFATAYLCAAVARLDACHADPERAMRINAVHMANLAESLASRGTYVVLLSTNQVFDGRQPHARPGEPVRPLSAYGRSKAEAERRILALAGRPGVATPGVLRLSKVIEPGMPLLASWVHRLRRGEAVQAARDMSLAPLPITDVVRALRAMAERRTPGIVQLASATEISYVDAALHVAGRIGAPAELVVPVDSVAAGFLRETPPLHTLLDGTRAARELGIAPAQPLATLDACLTPLLTWGGL